MLVEVLEGPLRYRYRLIGTHVVDASGEDRTGRYFDDVSFFKLNPVVTRQYDAVVANGRPLYSLEPFTNLRTGSTYEVDRLLLPLSSDGKRVDMVMVLFQFKTGAHARRLVIDPARAGARPVAGPPRDGPPNSRKADHAGAERQN